MEQKKLKALRELNLLDRFLFSQVTEAPGTFRMRCGQDPGLSLDDGAVRMFLHTRGEPEPEESQELQEFLRYVEHSDGQPAGRFSGPRMQKLHDRVLSVKQNE